MKIYMAAPIFNEMELKRNDEINRIVEDLGFETYLPQRDGGVVDDLIKKNKDVEIADLEKTIFNLDIEQMNNCDMILFLLDGIALDEGACFELGYMYAKNKRCAGYKTDLRSHIDGKENLMIRKALEEISTNREDLKKYLQKVRCSI